MKVLGSVAIVSSSDRESAIRRYESLLGAPPSREFAIAGRGLTVTAFSGISLLTGEPTGLQPLAGLRATVFVDSLAEVEVELLRDGWTMQGSLGAGASLLAQDPDGNLLEFVELSGEE